MSSRRNAIRTAIGICLVTAMHGSAFGAPESRPGVAVNAATVTLQIQKRGLGVGAVTANVPGLQCSESSRTCRASYAAGTQLQLTAAPSAGVTFGGWNGACAGTGPCSLTLNADTTVGAAFDPSTVTQVVTSSGGRVVLGGVGDVLFPSGALPGTQTVTLSSTRTVETRLDFNTTAVLFSPSGRSPYELRISTGAVPPTAPVEVTLAIPASLAGMSSTNEFQVMAQVYESGGSDVLDTFEPFASAATATTVVATLPPAAFTNARTLDASYEAIVVLAALPTLPPTSLTTAARPTSGASVGEKAIPLPLDALRPDEVTKLLEAANATCGGSSLGQPVNGGAPVTSDFNPAVSHYGTDYGVPNNTQVLSMADGKVEVIGTDIRKVPRPDARSGSRTKGWGQYVVVRHSDGSASLYAHLEIGGVLVTRGQDVHRGDVLARSDNSGGSSGPHLHVEYAPNGQLFGAAGRTSKVDPAPCIGANVNGSITVRDNGTLADDAFTVSLNGAQICATSIGASNTCAANNLRPGTVTLTIVCTVAPDDVGTFEISLANGLTFSGGGTTRSGTIPQGGSASFSVIVPSI